MALNTIVSALTHPGKKRPYNQDFVAHFEPDNLEDYQASGCLYIVADGVGGESQGDVASRYAAQKVLYEYFRQPHVEIKDRLTELIRQAGNDICHFAEVEENHRRMATTMVAAVIKDNFLTVANVGDSRAYLIRDGVVNQITKDHSLLGEKVRSGALTEEEALTAKVKNRITRSLGGETNVRVDIFENMPLQAGDQILLCTDGLSQYTTRKILAQVIFGKMPNEAAQSLIDYANQQGGSDNISVILIEVTDLPSEYPTQISQRGIPVPDDWDSMSTSPGGKGIRRFWKKKSLRIRLGIIGMVGILVLVLVLVGFGRILAKKGGAETPTPSAWEVDSQIKSTIEPINQAAPSDGLDSSTILASPTAKSEPQVDTAVGTKNSPDSNQTKLGN